MAAGLFRLGPVLSEHAIELDNLGSRQRELVAHLVEGALGGRHQQAEHERGHGRNHADPQLHDVLGVLLKMVTGQAVSQELTCEGTAEDTRKNNHGDRERIHDQE